MEKGKKIKGPKFNRSRPITGKTKKNRYWNKNYHGKNKFFAEPDGMLVDRNHFKSIYNSDFLAKSIIEAVEKRNRKLFRGDYVNDNYGELDIISPYHYDQVIRRSNGYSRNTYGQMFRP